MRLASGWSLSAIQAAKNWAQGELVVLSSIKPMNWPNQIGFNAGILRLASKHEAVSELDTRSAQFRPNWIGLSSLMARLACPISLRNRGLSAQRKQFSLSALKWCAQRECHTLISFRNHCLSACDLCLTTSKCLIPIFVESVKLWDVSERKQPKTQKQEVNLSNMGVNFLERGRGGELINYGVHSGIFLKKPLGGNHLHFVKKWRPGYSGLP